MWQRVGCSVAGQSLAPSPFGLRASALVVLRSFEGQEPSSCLAANARFAAHEHKRGRAEPKHGEAIASPEGIALTQNCCLHGRHRLTFSIRLDPPAANARLATQEQGARQASGSFAMIRE